MSISGRNRCMDTIKGIACIAVVLIHYNWWGDLGICIKAISRCAVPYFFFVSGYYLPDRNLEIRKDGVRRKIRHIFEMLLRAGAVYLLFCIGWNFLMDYDWSILSYIGEKITAAKVIKLLVTNDPLVYSHFWYMLALLYCYFVMYFVQDRMSNPVMLTLSLILMLGFSALAEFNGILNLKNYYAMGGSGSQIALSSLFVFRALPFFLLGTYFRKAGVSSRKKLKMPILWLGFAAGGILTLVEHYTFTKSESWSILFYIGTYVSVISLSLMSVWYPQWSVTCLEYLGNRLSMYVYIYHIIVGKVVDMFASKLRLWDSTLFKMTKPMIVVIGAIVFAWMIVKAKEMLKQRYAKTA